MGSIASDITDDLSRQVYCILGMPVDAIEMQSALQRIETAAVTKTPFLISTPNVNFLVNIQSDSKFRESLLLSDLSPADGLPIVLIARLLGIPIKSRVAGSDIFEALKARRNISASLKVFLFGGPHGVAAAACQALNVQPGGVRCVGSLYPGFGSIDDMSRNEIIDSINASDADFLVVALGAQRGQLWLQRNHYRLRIPVRAHLGAVVNFQAARVRRAPLIMRKLGLEWLWRIKEEPHLWRRYWNDGRALLRLFLSRILPLAIWTWWRRRSYQVYGKDLVIKQANDYRTVTISFSGPATASHIEKIIAAFRNALSTNKQIAIDFSDTSAIDARFLGLLLMLRKKLKGDNRIPLLIGLSPKLQSVFRLHGLDYLLFSDKGVNSSDTSIPA